MTAESYSENRSYHSKVPRAVVAVVSWEWKYENIDSNIIVKPERYFGEKVCIDNSLSYFTKYFDWQCEAKNCGR